MLKLNESYVFFTNPGTCETRSAALLSSPRTVTEDVARGELQPGREAYKHDYQRWRDAFPDGEIKVVNVIVQDNWAVVEFVNRGTHTGPLHSSLGVFPATGRKMEVRYCSVMRVADGMVVEGRDYYDSASIAKQLGLVGS